MVAANVDQGGNYISYVGSGLKGNHELRMLDLSENFILMLQNLDDLDLRTLSLAQNKLSSLEGGGHADRKTQEQAETGYENQKRSSRRIRHLHDSLISRRPATVEIALPRCSSQPHHHDRCFESGGERKKIQCKNRKQRCFNFVFSISPRSLKTGGTRSSNIFQKHIILIKFYIQKFIACVSLSFLQRLRFLPLDARISLGFASSV